MSWRRSLPLVSIQGDLRPVTRPEVWLPLRLEVAAIDLAGNRRFVARLGHLERIQYVVQLRSDGVTCVDDVLEGLQTQVHQFHVNPQLRCVSAELP